MSELDESGSRSEPRNSMPEQVLTRYLKALYPQFKHVLEFPPWLLPEHVINQVCDQLGDDALLELASHLGLSDNIEACLKDVPDPETIPDEAWGDAIAKWQSERKVKSIVEASLRACDKIFLCWQKREIQAELAQVCGCLLALALIPFLPKNEVLLTKLAAIFGVSEPSTMLSKYAQAVAEGEAHIVNQVNCCIFEGNAWPEFTTLFCRYAVSFPFVPKVVAVTPPLSPEVADVLISMMKEARDDKPGGTASEYQAN